MEQRNIRPYNGQRYSIEEGSEIIDELNQRTKHDDQEYNSMQSLGEKVKSHAQQIQGIASGYRGTIAIADTPTEDGIYTPTEAGTYVNAGNLVYDPEGVDEGKQVQFIKTSSSWVKSTINAPFNDYTRLIDFEVERTSEQLFDKRYFRDNKTISSAGVISDYTGRALTNNIYIPAGETTLSFLGIPSTTIRRLCWFDETDTLVLTNTISSTSATVSIPEGAKYFIFWFKHAEESYDVLDEFMVNFGDAIPYEPYSEKIISLNGVPFNTGGDQPTNEVAEVNWKYNNTDATVTGTELYKQFTLMPDKDADNDTIGCTGASYNPVTKEYVISYYSFDKAAELWFFKRPDLIEYSPTGTISPVPTRKIDVSPFIDHIQGNCYDVFLDSYWIVGTIKGAASNDSNRVIIRVDDEGNLLESTPVTSMTVQMGMIVHNPVSDTLLIKANNGSTLREIDKVTKNVIRSQSGMIGNEGLGFDVKNQIIWLASDSGELNSYKYSDFSLLESFTYETLPNTSGGTNVEGIIIDPIDGAILIVADAYLHGGNQNGNGLWIFDHKKTIKKSINFPYMFSFETGRLYDGLKIESNKLVGSGSWVSPIIDFENYTNFLSNDIDVIGENFSVSYRGSADAPTTQKIERTNWRALSYYDSWGETSPDSYSVNVPSKRYIQIKITL